ncbi:MAG: hypothetical protein ACE5F9_13840 [Phycisphaerae bacterium]
MKRNPQVVAAFITILIARAAGAGVSAAAADTTADAGKHITLQLEKSEIGAALRTIADLGKLNLVIGPGVEGEVTVALDDVPVRVALNRIAVDNGFHYTLQDGVISISNPDKDKAAKVRPATITRIFRLRSADAQHVKDVFEQVLTPDVGNIKVFDEDSQNMYETVTLNELGGDFGDSGGSAGSSTTDAATAGQEKDTPTSFSRTLVVTDIPEVVDQLADLIADLDRTPPQVLIEARLVEMSINLQRQLGIDWNLEIFANGPLLNHKLPLRNKAGFASGSQIQRNFTGFAQNVSGLALGTIDFSRFSAVLRANQDDNSVRLLANPRMLVRNNHGASILVGERYPIFEANITDFGTVTEAFDTYIPIGIQLEVKPTIMMDGRVSMFVHPAISSLGDVVVGTTGLRVNRVNTREISTRIIMRDGQTIALGGLITDRKTHAVSKVPGLGDLPILSALFRQENPISERTDLLIFLTARIDGALELSERDQKVFDRYQPHFKHIDRLQDVPLHFEVPTEYDLPRPMFSEPPIEPAEDIKDAEPVPDEDRVVREAPAARDSHPAVAANSIVHAKPTGESHAEQPDARPLATPSLQYVRVEQATSLDPASGRSRLRQPAAASVADPDEAINRWLESLAARPQRPRVPAATHEPVSRNPGRRPADNGLRLGPNPQDRDPLGAGGEPQSGVRANAPAAVRSVP